MPTSERTSIDAQTVVPTYSNLAVHPFAEFERLHPTEASLRSHPDCAGVSASALTTAIDRAYNVANALREPHDSATRKALGWIAVSGEDDQPYRPVNVPSTNFPQFEITVNVRDASGQRKPVTVPTPAKLPPVF